MTNEQRIIKVEENKNIIRKREYKMTTVKKNDFERTEGGEIIKVRNSTATPVPGARPAGRLSSGLITSVGVQLLLPCGH